MYTYNDNDLDRQTFEFSRNIIDFCDYVYIVPTHILSSHLTITKIFDSHMKSNEASYLICKLVYVQYNISNKNSPCIQTFILTKGIVNFYIYFILRPNIQTNNVQL